MGFIANFAHKGARWDLTQSCLIFTLCSSQQTSLPVLVSYQCHLIHIAFGCDYVGLGLSFLIWKSGGVMFILLPSQDCRSVCRDDISGSVG